MQTLRYSDYRRMPWKNGGGETIEIAISPSAAGLDDLDWRISMADVVTDGPFSAFPGIDRSLSILQGDGLILSVGDALAVELTASSAPFAFAADVPVHASLLGQPVKDFNVMTRRNNFGHSVRRVRIQARERVAIDASTVAVFCHSGHLLVENPGGRTSLDALDCVIENTPPAAWTLSAAAPAIAFVVEIKSH